MDPGVDAIFIPNHFLHPSQVYDAVVAERLESDIPMIMIEDVHSLHGMSAKSNFQFGRNVGLIHGILAITKIGIDLVAPKVWQKEVGVSVPATIKGAARAKAMKKATAEVCKRLYPTVDIYGPKGGLIDGKADALMIAHYCYLKYT